MSLASAKLVLTGPGLFLLGINGPGNEGSANRVGRAVNGHRIRQFGRIVPSQKACQKQGMLRASRHAVKSNFAGDGRMLPKPLQSVDRFLKFDIVNIAGVPEIASFAVAQWVGGKAMHRHSESVVRIPAGQAASTAMQEEDACTALFAVRHAERSSVRPCQKSHIIDHGSSSLTPGGDRSI